MMDWSYRQCIAGPGHKIAKTTPCKVEWAPARSTRAALRPGHEKKNGPSSALDRGGFHSESCEHGVRCMGEDGKQRPCRPPRGALALLPVADGLDGHAEFCREFSLRKPRAAAQVADGGRCRLRRRGGG